MALNIVQLCENKWLRSLCRCALCSGSAHREMSYHNRSPTNLLSLIQDLHALDTTNITTHSKSPTTKQINLLGEMVLKHPKTRTQSGQDLKIHTPRTPYTQCWHIGLDQLLAPGPHTSTSACTSGLKSLAVNAC